MMTDNQYFALQARLQGLSSLTTSFSKPIASPLGWPSDQSDSAADGCPQVEGLPPQNPFSVSHSGQTFQELEVIILNFRQSQPR